MFDFCVISHVFMFFFFLQSGRKYMLNLGQTAQDQTDNDLNLSETYLYDKKSKTKGYKVGLSSAYNKTEH